MAATIDSPPPSRAYHRNDVFLTLITDLITLQPAVISLDFTNTGPLLTETLLIEWAGNSIEFTVESVSNSTATAIPVWNGSETLPELVDRIFEAIRQNDLLTADFYVWRGPGTGSPQNISIRQIVPGVLDLTVTNALTDVAETVTDGADPATEENLSAYMQVFDQADDPNADVRLFALHAPYDVSNSLATFNLKDLISLQPARPDTDSINPASTSPWPIGIALGAFMRYYFRYADKYGVPGVSEALLKSNTYYMLHGSRPGNSLNTAISPSSVYLQHAYTRADGGTFMKPVAPDQPDWAYIWVDTEITGVHMQVDITWSDGSTTTEDVPSIYFDLEAKKLYWLASGPLQNAGSLSPISPDLELVAYNWRLFGDPGGGEVLLAQVSYQVNCPCHPWNLYLLMDNGFGGCETVLLRGKTKEKYEVTTRETAQRLRWTDYSVALGEMFNFNAEGQPTFEVNTGYHERWYIEHLRQLLLGQLWIIDVDNNRFLRVLCESKSVDISEDDQQLFSMSITLRAAWLDTNIHL